MNKLRDLGDCAFGLILIAVTFAIGYGFMGMIFEQAAVAAALPMG